MTQPTPSTSPFQWIRKTSWRLALPGLTLLGSGLLLTGRSPSWVLVRLGLIAAGMLLIGVAIRLHGRRMNWDQFEDRLESSILLGIASLGAILALLSMDAKWTSGKFFFSALTAVGLGASLLVLMPRTPRRVILVLLALFHLGGIVTAVATLPPPNGPAPWLVMQMWGRVYRPYLQFMHLNNAYHFYSPEPGPPCLLWFRIEYSFPSDYPPEKKKARWVKVGDRSASPTPIHHQRILALTESTNQLLPPSNDPRLFYLYELRTRQGQLSSIPLHPEVPASIQYREPQLLSKVMVSAYARYVAKQYPYLEDPKIKVKTIKVYRVVHGIINPHNLERGQDPMGKVTYFPYYQGEFTPDGEMITVAPVFNERGKLTNSNQADGFLYWLIPILADAKDPDAVHDYLARHAGDEEE